MIKFFKDLGKENSPRIKFFKDLGKEGIFKKRLFF